MYTWCVTLYKRISNCEHPLVCMVYTHCVIKILTFLFRILICILLYKNVRGFTKTLSYRSHMILLHFIMIINCVKHAISPLCKFHTYMFAYVNVCDAIHTKCVYIYMVWHQFMITLFCLYNLSIIHTWLCVYV